MRESVHESVHVVLRKSKVSLCLCVGVHVNMGARDGRQKEMGVARKRQTEGGER